MKNTKKRYWDLLKEEVELVQIEELLQNAGDFFEARSVKADRDQLHQERMILKQRLKLKVVS
jgi:hypothetical protein